MDKHVDHVSSSARFHNYFIVKSSVPEVSGENLLG